MPSRSPATSPRHGVDSILAESLHHHPLEHGAHHERYFVELGAAARLLLGLCFCTHCLDGARRRGADPEELRRRACDELERAFAGEERAGPAELSRERGGGTAGRPARRAARGSLRGRDRARRRGRRGGGAHGARLELLDASGAVKGYAAGGPQGDAAPVDRVAAGRRRGGVRAGGGGDRRDRLCRRPGARGTRPRRLPRARRRRAARGGAAPRVSPTAAPPRTSRPSSRSPRDAGVDRVDIYHYGFAPLSALDRVREALA